MLKELEFQDERFEKDVRDALGIYDRPIYATDAEKLEKLDCECYLKPEDYKTLAAFKNLKRLSIETAEWALPTISTLVQLEELDLTIEWDENGIDFRAFRPLTHLNRLYVCGGDLSSMNLYNLDALSELKSLTELYLHEFGEVDLDQLKDMVWLKHLYCAYADSVKNPESISKLTGLESLTLVYFEVDNLDFLDTLPESIYLDLSALEVKQEYDLRRLERFSQREVSNMWIAGIRFPPYF